MSATLFVVLLLCVQRPYAATAPPYAVLFQSGHCLQFDAQDLRVYVTVLLLCKFFSPPVCLNKKNSEEDIWHKGISLQDATSSHRKEL